MVRLNLQNFQNELLLIRIFGPKQSQVILIDLLGQHQLILVEAVVAVNFEYFPQHEGELGGLFVQINNFKYFVEYVELVLNFEDLTEVLRAIDQILCLLPDHTIDMAIHYLALVV